MSEDLLVLAGDAAAMLERHGFVACGRREGGRTRVEFWTKDGSTYKYVLTGVERTVTEIVAACLAVVRVGQAQGAQLS